MISKNLTRAWTAALALVASGGATIAQDQHATWIGAGGSVAADGASSTAAHGQLQVGTLHLDAAGNFLWLIDARLAGQYGALDGEENGGGALELEGAVGYTSLADSARGCGFFALAGASGAGEFHYPRPAPHDRLTGGPRAWAGLQCNLLRDLTLMAGPMAALTYGITSHGETTDALSPGGQVLVSMDDTFLARAGVTHTAAGQEDGGEITRVTLGGFFTHGLFYAGADVETGQVSSELLSPRAGVALSGETTSVPFVQANAVVGIAF